MNVIVNGEAKQFDSTELTVNKLLSACEVTMPEMVSVQINGNFVDRSEYATRQVAKGDSVDFLYFMGGGAR
jgi:sulfur carrier protein